MVEAAGGGTLRFLVDHMLQKLGRYLRIVGLDAAEGGGRTHELIRRADAEGRVFLTRNTHLGEQYPVPERWLLLRSDDPVQQLREVVAAFGVDPRAALFTRCIRCNVALADEPDPGPAVPERVRRRYTRFFRCPSCGTVFWHGSHVANTCRKLGLAPPSAEP